MNHILSVPHLPVVWHLNHPEHKDKPWSVQVEALRRAGDQRGYGWWLEQGLGKTPLALNDFYDKWKRGLCDACIVIAPNSFKLDWAVAVEEWGIASEIEYAWWPAVQLPDDHLMNQLLAINYEAISRPGKVKDYLLWLMEQSRIYLVIDESTAIGKLTQTMRSVVEFAKRAEFVRELNGTPLTQNVMDYYGQLRALGELNGTNPIAFRNRFAVMGGFMGKQVKSIRNEEELARILDRCTFRALKKDWRKDLPPKVHTLVHVEMTKRQRRHYTEMMEDFYTQVVDMDVSADMVLVQMGKLRQISSCLIMNEGKVEWIEKPGDIPKLQAVVDWVSSSPGKAMVTCIYKSSIELLRKTFIDMKLNPAVIRGGMTPQQWAEEKRRFNDTYECRVLVGQQSAIFRGHTLIGRKDDACSRMFMYESDFSYYERAQLEDRIHRGAQLETCFYTDVLTSPIDRHTLSLITGKRNLANWMDGLVFSIKNRDW